MDEREQPRIRYDHCHLCGEIINPDEDFYLCNQCYKELEKAKEKLKKTHEEINNAISYYYLKTLSERTTKYDSLLRFIQKLRNIIEEKEEEQDE